MANSTDPFARTIHGTNPQNLVEKILRTKIYQNNYWKEQCFGLTAETLVDKAMELDHLGGTYGGNRRPTPFMCLVLKMLQIQPDKDIVVEFIKNEDYKYVRILGAFYLRITGTMADVYQYLEPLYNDYRKLRRKLNDGNFSLIHVDEFIDELLTQDSSCDIALPRLQKRMTLEGTGVLEPRRSALEDDFEEEEENEEDKKAQAMDIDDHHKDHHRGRSPIKDRDRDRDRDRDGGRDRDRDSHRDRDRDRYKNRDRDDRDYERVRDRDRDIDRDRDRDRYKERERRERDRDRGRYRSRSRDRRDRERDEGEERRRWGRGTPSPQREERKKKKEKKEKKEMKSDGTDHPDPEIAEANKLRASLGLKPLRV